MLEALAQIVKTAAREELLPRFAESERRFKADGSIVTEADVAMQQRLTEELSVFAPDIYLIGRRDDRRRAAAGYCNPATPGCGAWILWTAPAILPAASRFFAFPWGCSSAANPR